MVFGTLKETIVQHETIVSASETSSKMASTVCQNGFKKPVFFGQKSQNFV